MTYNDVFPGKTFKVDLSPEHRTLLDGIPMDVVTAQVTKVEYLVAMTLKTMQSESLTSQEIDKNLSRLDTYTANVASQSKKLWTEVIHPELVKIIVDTKKAETDKKADEQQDIAALTQLAAEVAQKDKKEKKKKKKDKDEKDKKEKKKKDKDEKDKKENKENKDKTDKTDTAAAPAAKRQK